MMLAAHDSLSNRKKLAQLMSYIDTLSGWTPPVLPLNVTATARSVLMLIYHESALQGNSPELEAFPFLKTLRSILTQEDPDYGPVVGKSLMEDSDFQKHFLFRPSLCELVDGSDEMFPSALSNIPAPLLCWLLLLVL